MTKKETSLYTCQKCKKNCASVYIDDTRKKWICEKCWNEENSYVEED